ncbi:hypothetical protein [Paenibacillus chitinolyticus]
MKKLDHNELKEGMDNLNQAILEHLSARTDGTERTTGSPINIDRIRFKNLWVHFGLNGSDHDTRKGRAMEDCFLKSIVHLDNGSREYKKAQAQLVKKGYIYNTYFKKPVEFYASRGWYQIWQHPDFFEGYPEYKDKLIDIPGALEFLLMHQKTAEDNYVVFSDLLFIRDRNSKNIAASLILETLGDSIWDSWMNQINYFSPMGITVANAQAQDFIRKRLKGEKYSYHVQHKNIPVILSSQFSGGVLSDPFYGLLRDLFMEVSTKTLNEKLIEHMSETV